MLAKLAALIAHEAQARFVAPVVAEYRKLDAPPGCQRAHADGRAYDVASTTGAQVERATQFDHDQRPPVTAAEARQIGFTSSRSRERR